MRLLYNIVVLCLFWYLSCITSLYAYSDQEVVQLLKNKNISIVRDKRVLTSVSPRIYQSPKDLISTGALYWLDRLPVEDRKTKHFIVSPKWGIVAPIIVPRTGVDYGYLVKNDLFDYHPYLQQWVLWFPTTSPLWSTGNAVLFGHSSYWKNISGNYHTIFMLLPLIEKKEELWLYTDHGSGVYTRTVYTVSSSFKTSKDDVAIMNKISSKKTYLTLVTCVPIGTAKERWIVRAVSKN